MPIAAASNAHRTHSPRCFRRNPIFRPPQHHERREIRIRHRNFCARSGGGFGDADHRFGQGAWFRKKRSEGGASNLLSDDRLARRARPLSTRLPSPHFPSEFGEEVILRSEEHTSELQSLMRISYAVFCLKK